MPPDIDPGLPSERTALAAVRTALALAMATLAALRLAGLGVISWFLVASASAAVGITMAHRHGRPLFGPGHRHLALTLMAAQLAVVELAVAAGY